MRASRKIAAGILLMASIGVAHAAERSTEAFYAEATALKASGIKALFSGRIGALRSEGQAAGAAAKATREAAMKRGQKPAYCPPPNATMADNEMLAGLARISKAERERLPLSLGMTRVLAAKWPCR